MKERIQKKFLVSIVLVTPYMQHRMDDEKLNDWEKRRGKIIERDEVSKEDNLRANYHSFINKDGGFYMPADHIRMSLIGAGSFVKSKVGNARKSMKNIVAAMFTVTPEEIPLPVFDEIDRRSAVNKNVKARVMVVRPKWNAGLKVDFEIIIDDDTITKETVLALLEYSGRYVGIGSYRPEHTGSFGRYEVEKLDEVVQPKIKKVA